MPQAEQGSPLWWLQHLYPKLQERGKAIAKFEDYYDGRQPMAFATTKYREEFGRMLRDLCDNWMQLVVDAVEERLHVEGFRIGGSESGDDAAWKIWQRNQLDSDSELTHSVALITGWGPVMVWAGADEKAEITVEHPAQVLVAYEAGARRKRAAAIKVWLDEWTGKPFANVYLPDGIWKFEGPVPGARTKTNRQTTQTMLPAMGGSTHRPWIERAETVANPLKVVPIVELLNRPKLLPVGAGRSEIESVLSTQDQINKLVADMVVAAEFSAFRQRWATGVEIPTDPETGEEVKAFLSSISRLWHVPDTGAQFGEFQPTDLGNYVKAIENRVQSLASRTRTPPHYLLGNSGSFPSGESLKSTETGLIAKVGSKQRHFGEGHEEIIRLSFLVEGDQRAEDFSAETIWKDPESRSESEHIDALVKQIALGVPLQKLQERAGYTPTEIKRFKSMILEEALARSMGAPLIPEVAPGGAPVKNEPDSAAA